MTPEPFRAGLSFEQLVHSADDLRERISREIEHAIGRVDATSPRAVSSRAALHRLAATLPEVSTVRLMKLAAVDHTTHGAVMIMVKATLDVIGPGFDVPDAAAMLGIFDGLIAETEKRRLH